MKKPENNPFIEPEKLDFKPVPELKKPDAEKQAEQLREAVNYHNYKYYVENNPVISDNVYDQLFERLKTLEDEFDLQSENSPTQKVGGQPVERFETVEHVTPMLSLDSSEEAADVENFDKQIQRKVENPRYHLEPKFDGVSIELVYEDGEFQRAVTRGNGIEGDDVTQNVRTIKTIPLTLKDAPERLALRGEIYIPKDAFTEMNKERVERGEETFANPRNATAGTIRQLDSKVVAERPLGIFIYDIIDTNIELQTQKEAMDLIEELGFPVSRENKLVDDIQGFIDYRNNLMGKRSELDYDIDGVVAKLNSISQREQLGMTAAHPKWAYAYKFPAKKGETKVEQIVVQIGRTGRMTPVALLEPVDVKGVTISRATLHNEAQAKKLGVQEGSTVSVERAGDVIPYVSKVTENKKEDAFNMPSTCPVCDSKVMQEGENHFCTGGSSCPAQLRRGLQHYASRQAMDIEGIGEKLANQMVGKEIVTSIPELYRLEKEDLLTLEGFADRSAEKLLANIKSSKKTDLTSFITGLGIRHVGRETARTLAANFSLEELEKAGLQELTEIGEIGMETAESIEQFFRGHGKEMVDELLELGVKPERTETSEELEGITFVITGSLEGYTRGELKDLLENNGAKVTSSVSSNTDYLITGENPGKTKVADAEENNVKQLNSEQFRKQILDRL